VNGVARSSAAPGTRRSSPDLPCSAPLRSAPLRSAPLRSARSRLARRYRAPRRHGANSGART
jgi:hypothetical protein